MTLVQSSQDLITSPVVEISFPSVALNLGLAAALSFALSQVYIRWGTALSNRRLFAGNFLLLACTTTLVITVVKSSLALSLGLVGALSVVRFRSAIKEPEELAYLFMTIAIGLGLGADQRLITIGSVGIVCGLLVVRAFLRRQEREPNLFVTVASSDSSESQFRSIVDTLQAHAVSVNLRRVEERTDSLEASFLVRFENIDKLDAGRRALKQLDGAMQISFAESTGMP